MPTELPGPYNTLIAGVNALSLFWVLIKYYLGYYIKKDEVGGACSRHGGEKTCAVLTL
jgi:hypothetical protein